MVCYVPSTGTLALIGAGIYVLWHKAIGHFLGLFGTVMEIAVLLGAEACAAIALVWLTRLIRRRRAEAGACTTCRFRCQQALAARPNMLVNRVDRRVPAPARPALTCHPAAPLLPPRITASVPAVRRAAARPALRRAALSRPHPATPLGSRPAAPLGSRPAADGAPRFTGPVPAPFAVAGPILGPAPSPPPPAVREPEAVDVDGYVLTPDGVDAAESPKFSLPT